MVDIIIFIADDYLGGGVERSAMNIRQALVVKGYNVSIRTIKLFEDGYAKHFDFVRQVSSNHRVRLLFWYLFAINFRKLLKSNKDSVLIALGVTTSTLLGMLSFGIEMRALIGSERIYPPMEKYGRLNSLLRYLFFRRLDCVVAQSQKTAHWFFDNIGLKSRKLTVIPNIVVTPSLELVNLIQCNAGRDSYKSDYPVVACVGRLSAQKGFDYAVDIFSIVQKKIPLAKMIIVGDGPEKATLVGLVKRLGLTANITFVPRLNDLSGVFMTSDILLFPSRYEGFPNVLAEAMAHGLPAVAFDCLTGPADLIDHGVNGFLVDVGDVDAAAKLTLKLLDDHCLRDQFSARAMKVADKFSAEVIGEKWAALIERCSLRQ